MAGAGAKRRTLMLSRTAGLACACTVLIGLAVYPAAREAAAKTVLAACALAMVYAACRGCLVNHRPRTASNDGAADAAAGLMRSEIYRATTEALAAAIDAKDSYSNHDIGRVQAIAELIATQLGEDSDSVEGIRVAALLKDIGKLGVPDHILLKPGPLDPDEFARVRNHAAIGAAIVESVPNPWDLARLIRHHHERYDGTGYPDRLKGDDIPLGSRVIAVAGVYDALISDRCYRKGWSHQEAADHIQSLSGSHFDPRVVKAFFEVENQIVRLLADPGTERAKSPDGKCATADVIAQANRELMSVFEIAQTLSSTLELDEVVALLAHRTRRLTYAATCVVFIADPSRKNTLIARAAVGRHQEVFEGALVRVGRGVTGKAVARQRAFAGDYDPNDLTFTEPRSGPNDLKSCAAVPITSFGEVLGTVNVYDGAPHAFAEDDLRILAFVAQQAAAAVENAAAFEKVRESALRDPLTNLHNGRYLSSYLEREISRAQRLNEPLCVLGIDIDNFKQVNDIYGHRTGDQVLKGVADTLRRQLRDYDVVVRNGGDEFVVILPGVGRTEAQRTAGRIQQEVERYARETVPLASAGQAAPGSAFGVSVGVASYPDDAVDIEALLARADSDMYRDKRARKQSHRAA